MALPAEHQSWPALAVLLDNGEDILIQPPLKHEVVLRGCVALDMRGQLAGPQLIPVLPQASGGH